MEDASTPAKKRRPGPLDTDDFVSNLPASTSTSSLNEYPRHRRTSLDSPTSRSATKTVWGSPTKRASYMAATSSAHTNSGLVATMPPRAPSLTRGELYEVTYESGCVPPLDLVTSSPFQLEEEPVRSALYTAVEGETKTIFWGGRFPDPIGLYQDLVEELPRVLAVPGEIHRRIAALPYVNLYASKTQRTAMETEYATHTGPGHNSECASLHGPVIVLVSDVERENAFGTFSFLANACVFETASRNPPSGGNAIRIPFNVAEPLTRLASSVGRQPIVDYTSSVLTNWMFRVPSQGFSSVENIRVLRSFTGTVAEEWFYAVHLLIEQRGGKALRAMHDARSANIRFLHAESARNKTNEVETERSTALQRLLAHSNEFSIVLETPEQQQARRQRDRRSFVSDQQQTGDEESAIAHAALVASCMDQVAECMREIDVVMKRLPEKCPPEIFFDELRHWVSSWPDPGVAYETPCAQAGCFRGVEEIYKFAGASGAQSSLLPSIDGFLGIPYGQKPDKSEPTGPSARTDLGAFIRQLNKFRASMSPNHARLVERFEGEGNMRQAIAALDARLASSLASSSGDFRLEAAVEDLKRSYNACLENLIVFRKRHTDYATKYILTMAAKRGSAPGKGPEAGKGTGGSDFSTHLSRHVADTKRSMYQVRGGGDPSSRVSSTNLAAMDSPLIGMG